MRLHVKKWGNGLAVRLPRQDPSIGRLEEGMEVEVQVKVVAAKSNWKPYVVSGGPKDPSVNHDELMWGYMSERFGKRRQS